MALVGPHGMGPALVARLHDAFKATLDKLDQPAPYMSGAQYLDYAKKEVARDKEIVKRLKLAAS